MARGWRTVGAVAGFAVMSAVMGGCASDDASRAPGQGRRSIPFAEIVDDPPGPMALTSYGIPDQDGPGGMAAYVLDPATGRFERTGFPEARMSPDGRTVAGIRLDGAGNAAGLVLTDLLGGGREVVPLPPAAGFLRWSPNGRKVLATVEGPGPLKVEGFVVVDAGTGRLHFSAVTLRSPPAGGDEIPVASWGPRGEVVFVIGTGDAARLHRVGADGGDLGEGVPLRGAGGEALFSPSGRRLAASCDQESVCVWDASGPDLRPVGRLPGSPVLGWCDEERLFVARLRGDHWETVLVGLDGRDPRVIVRDAGWVPGAALTGVYGPLPR